jgi:predicted unusual protein kinase regulating ubiquinone biosynthesis (AarF/ABC1/UbiB family)
MTISICLTILKSARVRRRQASDATSEWARFARSPAARGRALGWLIMRVLCLFLLAKAGFYNDVLLNYSGKLFADGLLKIGPLYIKLGQIVSCRDDVLPTAWIRSMEKLQDQVPAKSGQEALDLAFSAWKSVSSETNATLDFMATFRDFDTTPLAAASLGQVHKAVLRSTGEVVAIKLQREFLRQIFDQDLALLEKGASIVDKLGRNIGGVSQSWTDIFKDAEAILYREIDYRDEAENGSRFCQDFGLSRGGNAAMNITSKSYDGQPLPSVYKDLCSEKVLVMEYVESIKITNMQRLDEAKVSLVDREYLSDMLARSYLRQFCCNQFFSTDPHPGNLGVEILNLNATESSERVRLVFYDFGQAATLTENQGRGILSIMEAIVDMDVDRSITAFQQMGVLKENADLDKVRAKVSENYKVRFDSVNKRRLKH